MQLLLICILLLSHSFIFFRFYFLLLCLCILIACLCIFIVPAGTLWLPCLKISRAFSSVVRQMSGYNLQRWGTARNFPKMFVLFYVLFVLCPSVYCLCVNVYCTTATRWQPNCSLTNIYHISIKCTCSVWCNFDRRACYCSDGMNNIRAIKCMFWTAHYCSYSATSAAFLVGNWETNVCF